MNNETAWNASSESSRMHVLESAGLTFSSAYDLCILDWADLPLKAREAVAIHGFDALSEYGFAE